MHDLVICQDLAPTLLALAGGTPGPQIQGRSLLPLFAATQAKSTAVSKPARVSTGQGNFPGVVPTAVDWRKSFLIEYWAENAMPWLIGMTYKAVRTDRYKYIHWVNRGTDGELDELYDLRADPYELENLNSSRDHQTVRARLRRELAKLSVQALGL